MRCVSHMLPIICLLLVICFYCSVVGYFDVSLMICAPQMPQTSPHLDMPLRCLSGVSSMRCVSNTLHLICLLLFLCLYCSVVGCFCTIWKPFVELLLARPPRTVPMIKPEREREKERARLIAYLLANTIVWVIGVLSLPYNIMYWVVLDLS